MSREIEQEGMDCLLFKIQRTLEIHHLQIEGIVELYGLFRSIGIVLDIYGSGRLKVNMKKHEAVHGLE